MMEDIYRRITGSSRNFSRWDAAEENFIELEWDEETSRHFLESARDAVEQDRDTLSQAYLDIRYPDEFDEDIDRGRELLSNIRSRYLEHYRILTQT